MSDKLHKKAVSSTAAGFSGATILATLAMLAQPMVSKRPTVQSTITAGLIGALLGIPIGILGKQALGKKPAGAAKAVKGVSNILQGFGESIGKWGGQPYLKSQQQHVSTAGKLGQTVGDVIRNTVGDNATQASIIHGLGLLAGTNKAFASYNPQKTPTNKFTAWWKNHTVKQGPLKSGRQQALQLAEANARQMKILNPAATAANIDDLRNQTLKRRGEFQFGGNKYYGAKGLKRKNFAKGYTATVLTAGLLNSFVQRLFGNTKPIDDTKSE